MASADGTEFVDHPLLTDGVVERRLYQLDLAGTAKRAHTLVCLPTGLGKTTVSLLVTAERFSETDGKALLLAPTKPLVRQHAQFYRTALTIPDEEVVVFTGDVSPADRAALWDDATVIVATPQVIENDLIGERISLHSVIHCTFDECHRATGEYAYTYIADRYHADATDPLVTGMSASPGGDREQILQVCENLGIERIAVKTEDDPDVARYTHETDVDWVRVELPDELISIRDGLQAVIEDRLETLKELGVATSTDPSVSEADLREMRGALQRLIDADNAKGYEGMSAHAEIRKLKTAVTYVETQSVESLRRYFERQRDAARSSGASKASQRFVSDPRVREAMETANAFDDRHPKFSEARRLLAETLGLDGGQRAIVFTESRDTAETLTEFLGDHFDVRRFVGQSDREGSPGMTQTEQKDTLAAFRTGAFEVLVSTSVAEEGLDVPEVDLVLFYEPVPTAIRAVQRKGRTGRQAPGRVVVLLAEDTRDEAYFWMSRNREEEMETELRELQAAADDIEAELEAERQARLEQFSQAAGDVSAGLHPVDSNTTASGTTWANASESTPDQEANPDSADPVEEETDMATEPQGTTAPPASEEGTAVGIVVDQRETDSTIARQLSEREDVTVRLETLAVGDYVLSDRVVVERKSVSDFLSSLIDGDRSVFDQAGNLARHYGRPVFILEGSGLYEERNVHPNAIRGALSSLAIDFDTSVLHTEDEADTTELLHVIAAREQELTDREVAVHGDKSGRTLAEQQEYVVSAIADIGPVTARSLLEHFGSVAAVMNASEEDLQNVQGVGEVTAERIREVATSEYNS